ncbi:proton-associated sugar transporter A isoform X2 [Ischnura elegans]|uniref:proton-associated sugar transporter A isoform X2 n=1 Tax=Ischnura elegans TaxID=197161 RepID=UPI001ED8A894|nr:proton-associated sugar transporter A isoform X2 [Ischnura elegans]
MTDKLHEYQGVIGRLHSIRDDAKNKYAEFKEGGGIRGMAMRQSEPGKADPSDFSHIYRRKERSELIRISAAVMGIEFSYAAETAFVSPTLLKIGVEHRHMTLVWGLSPTIGFFLTPLLGSLSDRCRLNLGRRRPFIIALAIGVLLGLILVPNGEDMGYAMGDQRPPPPSAHVNATAPGSPPRAPPPPPPSHPWGLFFTILGTVLLDFDADACQSPSRAYLLDVTVPEDHARGLSTFTIMAGLGGCLGYALGGINWDATALGAMLGGHVRAVFTLITFIFITCVSVTVSSFKEIPLEILEKDGVELEKVRREAMSLTSPVAAVGTAGASDENSATLPSHHPSYGALATLQPPPPPPPDSVTEGNAEGVESSSGGVNQEATALVDVASAGNTAPEQPSGGGTAPTMDARGSEFAGEMPPTLSQYLSSIVVMPPSLRILCATNLFCWMAHVCYSLYFTDFVGEAVYGGNPKAEDGSAERELYEEGVRFGCWGMSMYSLSCSCYSMLIEKLVKRFKARAVYVGGQLVYCSGMIMMAICRHPVAVLLFSWSAGVMYSTLFTMPYLLVAHYHASGTFAEGGGTHAQIRGLGTDVAIVSSMVFLAQLTLSCFMGSLVAAVGSTTAVVAVAAFLSFCGALIATQVTYLDL